MVAVRLFEGCGLVIGQFQLERGDGFGQVMRSGRADDDGPADDWAWHSTHASATWAMVTPRAPASSCTALTTGSSRGESKACTNMVDAGPGGLLAPGAGQAAFALRGSRAPGRRRCRRTWPSALARPGGAAGCTGSAWIRTGSSRLGRRRAAVWRTARRASTMRRGSGPCGLDDVVQCFGGLGDRGGGVAAVDLVQVNVVGAEPGQGGVDLFHDRLAGQAGPAGPSCICRTPWWPGRCPRGANSA